MKVTSSLIGEGHCEIHTSKFKRSSIYNISLSLLNTVSILRVLFFRHRWYYTSDAVVREVTIEEVLNSSAYMLFYDRSTKTR